MEKNKLVLVRLNGVTSLGRYVHRKTAERRGAELCGFGRYEVLTAEQFSERCNELVTVVNCLTGKPVKIYRSMVGGPCDPSTVQYHSM